MPSDTSGVKAAVVAVEENQNMDAPITFDPRRVAPDTDALTTYIPVPGLGILPVNAFLIRAAQPVLVDAGIPALRDAFVENLKQRIDLHDLRWIWITHTDPDHLGALERLLAEAPRAKVVTTYLGMGKMGMQMLPLTPDRVYLLNPGQGLDVGDRRLLGVKPPSFDAPETTALFDTKTQAFFSADAFGALLREPAEDAAAISAEGLRDGSVTWASVDAPWLHTVDEAAFARALREIHDLAPSVVLSAHLPPARRMTAKLLSHLSSARTAAPFVGPDQQALMQMAAGGAAA